MKSYRALLADARFRRFWLALLLVMMADEFVRTSLVWEVYRTTGSAAVALLQICFTGPIVVGGLVAGWLLDRYPRGRVMAGDAAVRSGVLVLAAGTLMLGVGGIVPLFVLALVQGALTMVLLAGAPSAIAELIPPEARSAANALEMLGFSAASAAGPLAAGWLSGLLPMGGSLLLAACCYAAFALVVRSMPIGGGQRVARGARVPWRDSGVLHPTVAIITVMFLIVNIGGGVISVFLPVLVDQGLARGGETYGVLLAVIGSGSSLGAIGAGMVTRTARLPAAVAVMQILMGVALVPLAVVVAAGQASILTVVVCLFVQGVVSGPLTVWAQTVRMRFVAPEWRGRAFATLRMIMQSGRPVGGALGGVAVTALPLSLCLFAAAAIIALPAAVALCLPPINRRLRDKPA